MSDVYLANRMVHEKQLSYTEVCTMTLDALVRFYRSYEPWCAAVNAASKADS